jgi:hypothetical protein
MYLDAKQKSQSKTNQSWTPAFPITPAPLLVFSLSVNSTSLFPLLRHDHPQLLFLSLPTPKNHIFTSHHFQPSSCAGVTADSLLIGLPAPILPPLKPRSQNVPFKTQPEARTLHLKLKGISHTLSLKTLQRLQRTELEALDYRRTVPLGREEDGESGSLSSNPASPTARLPRLGEADALQFALQFMPHGKQRSLRPHGESRALTFSPKRKD